MENKHPVRALTWPAGALRFTTQKDGPVSPTLHHKAHGDVLDLRLALGDHLPAGHYLWLDSHSFGYDSESRDSERDAVICAAMKIPDERAELRFAVPEGLIFGDIKTGWGNIYYKTSPDENPPQFVQGSYSWQLIQSDLASYQPPTVPQAADRIIDIATLPIDRDDDDKEVYGIDVQLPRGQARRPVDAVVTMVFSDTTVTSSAILEGDLLIARTYFPKERIDRWNGKLLAIYAYYRYPVWIPGIGIPDAAQVHKSSGEVPFVSQFARYGVIDSRPPRP
ncbi:hypothetical protein GCM10009552_36350 [Rothia nasimurium]|uniref:Uncharacterized protein n=1 Tax=Luteibacter anthropi TaxID=564369 RepID=A0A7X5U7I7_9GAMM|nr:hypothetical protein [Luteibacter anthropi]NII05296.1 hypothetical protein [Luteibacter anthropi]